MSPPLPFQFEDPRLPEAGRATHAARGRTPITRPGFPGLLSFVLVLGSAGCAASGPMSGSDPFTRGGASTQGSAGASGAEASVDLRGTVLGGEEDEPLRGVLVTLTDRDGQEVAAARTDSLGVVALGRVAPGQYTVRARHEGFKPLEEPTEVRGLPPVRLHLHLADTDGDESSSVRLTATRDILAEVGFYERRERESGSFLVAEDIRRTNIPNMTELVASLPGFQIGSSGGATAAVGRRGCPPNLFLDGRRIGDTRQIDAVIPVSSVGALEAYPGTAPPGEFAGFGQQCGAVVVWTRRG